MDWPGNGGTMPSKSTPFTPSSILFRPRDGGVAGYRPRVRKVYYDGHLSPYPACAGTRNISAKGCKQKSKPRRRGILRLLAIDNVKQHESSARPRESGDPDWIP